MKMQIQEETNKRKVPTINTNKQSSNMVFLKIKHIKLKM